jgi:hypothetical protein
LFLMVMSAFAMIFSIFIGVGGKGNFWRWRRIRLLKEILFMKT